MGRTVVADAVNPLEITRKGWGEVASRTGVKLIDIVITCSDTLEHKRRIEAYPVGNRASTWAEIVEREFGATQDKAIAIDTSNQTVEQCLGAMLRAIETRMG